MLSKETLLSKRGRLSIYLLNADSGFITTYEKGYSAEWVLLLLSTFCWYYLYTCTYIRKYCKTSKYVFYHWQVWTAFLKKSVFCHYIRLTTAGSMCRQAEKQGQTWVWLSRWLQQSSHAIPHACADTHTETHKHWLRIFTFIYPLVSITFLIHQAGLILPAWGCRFFVTSRSTLICEGNTCNTAPRGKPPVLN